jgi:signal peptidase I
MTQYQWFLFFLLVQVIHFLGTWKLYEAAGRKRWEAAIPVYNAIILMKIIGRPSWWTFLLFIPIINLVLFPVIWIETLRSFGKKSSIDTFLGIATFGLYLFLINYSKDLNYVKDRNLNPENKASDTVSSLLFAIIVATLVHTYFIQPYTIPTSSLEKSLLVGDFLFVSKMNYGARIPMTTVALPMVHDSIPIVKTKSYLNYPQLPYLRLPAFQKIARTDIVVFNWPVDTVRYFFEKTGKAGVIKPIDKKSNYVKRCVGIPGDSLSIKNGFVYINGQILALPERAKPQFSYTITTDGTSFDPTYLLKELNITDGVYQTAQNAYYFNALTEESASRLKNNPIVKSIVKNVATEVEPAIFPQISKWNRDNFGPIYIPQKGKTVALSAETIPFYKRIISVYENNDLQVNGDEIRINGEVAKNYTFKQDYFWMMGDNRHNSEDSRYWGFVPEDHIVGKPVFIWMSWDTHGSGLNKIRWERLFTTVNGSGEPQSYFKYFLFALAAYFVGEYFWKRRKERKG